MDPQVRLEEYDWGELEEQFGKRMEAFKAVEEGIWEEWREWGEVFKVSFLFLFLYFVEEFLERDIVFLF